MYVIKRDGSRVLFNPVKIVEAINKAMVSTYGSIFETDTAEEIADIIGKRNHDMSVEEIQDMVEELLMRSDYSDVAKAYILYRDKRNRERIKNSSMMKTIKEKLSASNVKNQNANVDEYSFGGRMGEANSAMTRQIALDEYVSPMARENHLGNMIYIHDLDHYVVGDHNCLSIPFDDLLAKGFNTRQTDVRPAGSVSTAFQLVAVIFQLQSLQQFGGVSATHLDWTMVPYVRKSFAKHYKDGLKYINHIKEDEIDYEIENMLINATEYSIDDGEYWAYNYAAYDYAIDMTEREIKQAVEGMFHNLNTLQSRSGNQLPFTSINFGTCTQREGRMVIKALLEGSIAGVGKLHKTSIFPCSIFQCMKGVNRAPDDPNYDMFQLALKSTSLRLYPNYANVDWSGNAGYDRNDPKTYFSTMGCRTANGYDVNGFGQLKDGRGNICPVTIIMPTLAMMAKEQWEEDVANEETLIDHFMRILDQKIHEAKDMLIERFDYICSQSPESAKFMYENGVMAGYVPEEGIRSALKHGTLALG